MPSAGCCGPVVASTRGVLPKVSSDYSPHFRSGHGFVPLDQRHNADWQARIGAKLDLKVAFDRRAPQSRERGG